ncbi:MAG: hypothetical protein WCY11_10400 [Novosphingobium sp.]
MPRFNKTAQELEDELIEQVLDLRATAARYDSGDHWEAKHLASCVYLLCHDATTKGRSKSLLGLTGRKHGMKFLSSRFRMPNSGQSLAGMATSLVSIIVRIDDAEYVPYLERHPDPTQMTWDSYSTWSDQPVFGERLGIRLSRRNIIFGLRNQDGGAHVDAARSDENYHGFLKFGDPGVRIEPGFGIVFGADPDKFAPVRNGVRATMRQIAWEVNETLKAIGL